MQEPLAERMRPKKLDDYIGQEQLVGPEGFLRKSIEIRVVPSMILWGPPGVGKTTLAHIMANESGAPFHTLSAISSGVKDVREVLKTAEQQSFFNEKRPILFIDEIHRFSKSQQDSLLGAVEKGTITLIGATTENPSFEVIPALLSRAQVYVLNSMNAEQLQSLLDKALREDQWLREKDIQIESTKALFRYSGGDARKLFNILELVINQQSGKILLNDNLVENVLQDKAARYDKAGDQHYDIISAFIKSIRGSDPNAAVYWLARMIEGGEDPKFIARRLIISAAEDIGIVNPTALVLANSTFEAVSKIGFPEARILLSECTVYLATSAKSNSSYMAINKAQALVKQTGDLPVPLALRNAPTKLMKELDYGKGYKYSHDYPGNFVPQDFLPEEISGRVLFEPNQNDREDKLRALLKAQWKGKYKY